ncbi:hypothetical protein GQ54DRAFT_297165 [Martensiomyces pterosporus]|nr:hypothetical protein GQ54DRAFT_297165 [Martensiomyces pterosporus]
MGNYTHTQQSSTSFRLRLDAMSSSAVLGSSNPQRLSRQPLLTTYGTIDSTSRVASNDALPLEPGDGDNAGVAREAADDKNPVCAYFEILAIRSLLLEHVSVVLSPGQLHSPDVQINLISPLWLATRERCGVWRRGDMRHPQTTASVFKDSLGNSLEVQEEEEEEDGIEKSVDQSRKHTGSNGGGPLVSAATLYAALANRDYFMVLASAGQSQAELHESRAEVAEALAILCVKSLHKLGSQALENALCVKYTPIDIDGLCAEIASSTTSGPEELQHGSLARTVVIGDDGEWRLPNPIRGERHMSLLSAEQRVRVYRLGKAGDMGGEEDVGTSSRVWNGGIMPRSQAGWSTPAQELTQEYLWNGSRIVVERAIEVAIRSEAKRFTAQKLVGEVVRLLWDGTLHWKGYQCICLAATSLPPQPQAELQADESPGTEQAPPEEMLTFARRESSNSELAMGLLSTSNLSSGGLSVLGSSGGIGAQNVDHGVSPRQDAVEKWMAQTLEPLRIPMVENVLTMVHAFFFLTLYTIVSLRRQEDVSIEEAMLHVCAVAYIADEIRQCMESGLVVYFKSVWNVLDVSIYAVFTAFLALRIRSLYTGSEADLDKAYDVLSLNASMLWPRLFAVLDQYEFCGTIIIQVRRIISGTSLFFALLIVMTAGFFQTFFSLSQRHNELRAADVWGLMARIFFGSALLGWDQADLFGPYVGHFVMSMYIGVSMLILYNILIGVINQCMVEITQNAAQEFRFAYTMRVAEYVSAKQTYPCVPPLNLLQVLVFWPLRKTTTLSPRHFSLFRSATLVAAYAPHLLFYMVYKRAGRWWRAKSGMHRKALRAECFLAEKELALIKIGKSDIDEFAFAGGADDGGSSNEANCSTSGGCGGGDAAKTMAFGAERVGSTTAAVVPACGENRKPRRAMSTFVEPAPKALGESPTLTVRTMGGSSNNRWTNLLHTWSVRRRSPLPQIPGWSPFIQQATSAATGAAGPSNASTNQLTNIDRRVADLELQMAEIDKKLATITRLLKPVTSDD